ncbi:MAG: preprotein translocase subunit SecG [Phycisphaerales bacterium]|nr:preprotein translocase subunit SecG [Phycisphaerales bacterium]
MLALSFIGSLLSVALILVSLLLIGLILLQKNRGAGLSGAFGGVGGHSAFGTKTGDFLTWVTVGLVTVFLLLNVAGNFAFEPESKSAKPPVGLDVPVGADGGASESDATNAGGDSGTESGATTPPPAGQ